MRFTTLTLVALLSTIFTSTDSAAPAQAVPAASVIVKAAVASAARDHRTVLIEFGASWCVWCRNFQAFIHAPEVKDIVARNFVVVNLTVKERDDKVALENPGGAAVLKGWGGENAGLPFYVFLDSNGRKIADSNAMPDGANIGFPATDQEVAVFAALMRKTAPRLSADAVRSIVAYLKKNAPAQ